jgi:hypothetical protein
VFHFGDFTARVDDVEREGLGAKMRLDTIPTLFMPTCASASSILIGDPEATPSSAQNRDRQSLSCSGVLDAHALVHVSCDLLGLLVHDVAKQVMKFVRTMPD